MYDHKKADSFRTLSLNDFFTAFFESYSILNPAAKSTKNMYIRSKHAV